MALSPARQAAGAAAVCAASGINSGPTYAVRRLALTDFRCYRRLRLEAGPLPVVLTGPNGAGKTNLLEAVSFLAPGRGLRRARLDEVTRIGARPAGVWGVAATVEGPGGETELGTGLQPAGEGRAAERRVVKVNGAVASGPALAEAVHLIWLTPQMDRLFLEAASGRRRFLDRLVYGFDADHARRVSAYERALRERSRLLREGRADPSWLGALEATMTEHGVAVAAARRAAVARLNGALEAGVGPFPRAELALDGTLEAWLAEGAALEAEDRFGAVLAEGRGRDAETGTVPVGPHRGDLLVRHVAKDVPAAQCSTGEQKALLIAIVLAEARLQALRRGAAPLLLLDEVAAHLDAERRAALFEEIVALGAQAWLTGTDRTLFAALEGRAQYFLVREGTLSTAS